MKNFWIKVNKTETCWLWTAATDGVGYGVFHVPGTKNKVKKAYAFCYELFKGKVPKGLELDHLCRNTMCVNPDHLEAVTHRENMRRGNGTPGVNYRKTHCKNGHEFSKENTIIINKKDGKRRLCRECNKILCKQRYHRHKPRLTT